MRRFDELDPPGRGHPGPPEPGLRGEGSNGAQASPVEGGGEDGGGEPRWPVWFGPAAFVGSVLLSVVVVVPLELVVRELGDIPRGVPVPALSIASTLITDVLLVACMVGLAALVSRPRPRHFGLRATPPWPAVGFTVLGIVTYVGFAALYERVYSEEVEQSTLETLGADRGPLALVVVGLLVVVAAPLTEELFFRGFLYRSLRTRLSIPTATLLTGGAFGLVHWNTGVAATLPLAVLGAVFCLIVERTGSLYPVIALHALVNAIAYSFSADAPDGSEAVALPLLAAMLAACVLLPRLAHAREARGSGGTAPATG